MESPGCSSPLLHSLSLQFCTVTSSEYLLTGPSEDKYVYSPPFPLKPSPLPHLQLILPVPFSLQPPLEGGENRRKGKMWSRTQQSNTRAQTTHGGHKGNKDPHCLVQKTSQEKWGPNSLCTTGGRKVLEEPPHPKRSLGRVSRRLRRLPGKDTGYL